MSRGFGPLQQWLLGFIGNKPVTFEQILDCAYPPGSYENDIAKAIGGSKVGRVRSLRRALGKLVDLDIIQIKGSYRPQRYRLHRLFAGDAHNPRMVLLHYKCFAWEQGETLEAKNAVAALRPQNWIVFG